MSTYINLVKLCVGVDSVEDLAAYRAAQNGRPSSHVTRMRPKRGEEILNGGSLYWVIKGMIRARQRIIGLEEVLGSDGVPRCGIVLAPELILTAHVQRRPFQGWRYLKPEDAPADLPKGRAAEPELPPELAQTLAEIGVI